MNALVDDGSSPAFILVAGIDQTMHPKKRFGGNWGKTLYPVLSVVFV
jgi:hypothetical protein